MFLKQNVPIMRNVNYCIIIFFFFNIQSRNINNGVYRSGFATSQEAYDAAVKDVFNALDKVTHNINLLLFEIFY